MNKMTDFNLEDLQQFLTLYNKVHPIDIYKSYQIIKNTIYYYKRSQNYNSNLVYPKCLVEKWYNELKNNNIDYSVYDDDYYFTDLWACWHLFSKLYIRNLTKKDSLKKNVSIYSYLKNINTVLDLGCGIGYTTAYLKLLFKNAEVYGTNLKGTKQYKFCESIGKKYNFNIVEDISAINKEIDFIFASEYFEHIEFATEHLKDIIEKLKPRYCYIANSFNTYSVGHFESYKYHNGFLISNYNQTEMSKIFNKILRSSNYRKVKTKLWNDRPTLWEKCNLG